MEQDDGHQCIWRERVEALEAKASRVEALEVQAAKVDAVMAKQAMEIAQLKKALLGPKTERMPSPHEQLKKKADPAKTKQKRRENKERFDELAVEHHEEALVPEDERTCTACGKEAQPINTEKTSSIYDYVPGYFRKRVVHRETVACSCGDYIRSAPPPPRVLGQSKFGPGFAAYLVVAKLCDSIPLYRLEKRFKRTGIPIARSTMNDLLLRTGSGLRILGERMLTLVAEQPVVQADETSLPVIKPKKCKRGFIWTFAARLGPHVIIGYRFSADRSGQTPIKILGVSEGVLLVDGYTGYNAVTTPEGRTRAACLAHIRRKFFEAMSTASIAGRAMELILDVYRVEHEAFERDIVRTEEHAELRRTRGRAAMDAFHAWVLEQEPLHPPKSPIGRAITHTLKNWDRLCVFLDDVDVPVDNNAAERFLRPFAKGRDNWMFAGNDEAADSMAGLMALVSTCEANGINPQLYLADVIERVETHPASRLDELLPHNWKPPDPDERTLEEIVAFSEFAAAT